MSAKWECELVEIHQVAATNPDKNVRQTNAEVVGQLREGFTRAVLRIVLS